MLGRTLSLTRTALRGARTFHASPAALGLLKGIDPLLTAELLHVLRSAGHGDEIVVVDCNYPASACAAETVYGEPVQLAGADMVEAVDAICSVMPLDFFIECPAQYSKIWSALLRFCADLAFDCLSGAIPWQ